MVVRDSSFFYQLAIIPHLRLKSRRDTVESPGGKRENEASILALFFWVTQLKTHLFCQTKKKTKTKTEKKDRRQLVRGKKKTGASLQNSPPVVHFMLLPSSSSEKLGMKT